MLWDSYSVSVISCWHQNKQKMAGNAIFVPNLKWFVKDGYGIFCQKMHILNSEPINLYVKVPNREYKNWTTLMYFIISTKTVFLQHFSIILGV